MTLPAPFSALAAQLALAGRRAVASGLVLGSGGNLSAREAGADALVCTASGTWLDALDDEAFSVVAVADGALQGGHPRPTSELALHLAAYTARPDACAVLHLHPQTSVLLAALGREIRLITLDHAYYVRTVRTVPFVQSGSAALGDAAAVELASADVVVLGHHGCVVVADSVELAYQRAANLEAAAVATYRALLLGDTTTVCPPAYLETVREREAGRA